MGAGFFSGEPTGNSDGIASNPDDWSEASKRSVAYSFDPQPYLDKAYLCLRCSAPDVFTAEDQKHTFEVRKANISQQRSLCVTCHREWFHLDREVREYRRQWATDRRGLHRDLKFLRHWLVVLEALAGYNSNVDRANIVMLRRLVAS